MATATVAAIDKITRPRDYIGTLAAPGLFRNPNVR